MHDPKARAATLPGLALGLALLAGWIVGWRVLRDAADEFAPATVAAGLLAWVAAHSAFCRRRPALVAGLRWGGYGAVALGVAAALSLGAFLPPAVADWVSPPLGRFGGFAALGLLAAFLALAGPAGFLRGPRGPVLDAIALAGFAALWVRRQVERQLSFPTPPTTVEELTPRLALLAGLALAGAGGAAILCWRERRAFAADYPYREWPGAVWRRWLWRWAGAFALLGLATGLVAGAAAWAAGFGALALGLLGGWLAMAWPPRPAPVGAAVLRGAGWALPVLLLAGLVYFATTEDLEVVLLRNTVERRVLLSWPGVTGGGPAAGRPTGALAGAVRDAAGRPLPDASVVVADARGRAYSAVGDAEGRYRIEGVPAGNYLPLAVAAGHRQGGAGGDRVATVRAGRTAGGVDFRLQPAPPFAIATNDSLRLEPPAEVVTDYPEPRAIGRRGFTFARDGLTLDGGLVHEPLPDQGPGPFPILLVIYPGEARDWEGVSAPLAAQGFVVVSYFPRRLLDLEGDLADLRLLLSLTLDGRLSPRGDPGRVALVGGSVSTVYTYLLARDLEGSPARGRIPATVQYGGLFDFFAFRRSWEEGQVVIDPGISALEYLLVAFGRPDTRPELYLRLSPRYDVRPTNLPPTLLVHADRDSIVPVDQSILAAATLAQREIPHRLLRYPDLEHYLDTSKRDPAQLDMLTQTVAFLREWLGQEGR